MKSIERIHLASMPTADVLMPDGGHVLGVGLEVSDRGDLPFLWVLADVDAHRKKRKYWVLLNGPHAPQGAGGYIGSVTSTDDMDFHVFDGSVDLTG